MYPAPAAGFAFSEAGLPGELETAVRLDQPQRDPDRARCGQGLIKQGGSKRVRVRCGLRGGPGRIESAQARVRSLFRRKLTGDLGGELGRALA